MEVPSYGFMLVVSGISGLVGSAAGSYFNEKTKNLATKEDIRELTMLAKTIENQVSDEFWNKQRVWELKRDALLNLAVALEPGVATHINELDTKL
jgi:hypothetical protein